MSHEARELYHSANGDRWALVRDSGSGQVFIEHQPNVSPGGRIFQVNIGEFLLRGGTGPEHQELLRLIGTLVTAHSPAMNLSAQRATCRLLPHHLWISPVSARPRSGHRLVRQKWV
jgi:hypothetical protein